MYSQTLLILLKGGDILVHAVCGERGKLFELAQAVLNDMPKGAVQSVEETYGFTYRDGRDLSGFVDGEFAHTPLSIHALYLHLSHIRISI